MGTNMADKIPAWEAEQLMTRLARCGVMLKIHGILTNREYEKVRCRLDMIADKLRTQKKEEPNGKA